MLTFHFSLHSQVHLVSGQVWSCGAFLSSRQLMFPTQFKAFLSLDFSLEKARSGRRINESEVRMPPRQALARQRQECVLGTNRSRTGGKEEGPGSERGDGDDFRQACSESCNISHSEWLWHGNCKWSLKISNYG